jgi:hypothetical protein
VKERVLVKRWLLISVALGLVAAAASYVILLTTDQCFVRLFTVLVWPAGLFLLANEGATTSLEVATNFAKAIVGNVVLYAAVGSLFFGVMTAVRRGATGGGHVSMRSNPPLERPGARVAVNHPGQRLAPAAKRPGVPGKP